MKNEDSFYRFPRLKEIEQLSRKDQVAKIRSECIEADKASIRYGLYRGEDERSDYGIELMDVIHAVETALRMEFDDEEVKELRDHTERKNRERGYYDAD